MRLNRATFTHNFSWRHWKRQPPHRECCRRSRGTWCRSRAPKPASLWQRRAVWGLSTSSWRSSHRRRSSTPAPRRLRSRVGIWTSRAASGRCLEWRNHFRVQLQSVESVPLEMEIIIIPIRMSGGSRSLTALMPHTMLVWPSFTIAEPSAVLMDFAFILIGRNLSNWRPSGRTLWLM